MGLLPRFDLIDQGTLLRLAEVLAEGHEKHPEEGWRKLSPGEHLWHALGHITQYYKGDTSEDHLGHAFTRLMMAVAVEQAQKENRP